MSQRVDDVQRWERELKEKREGYKVLTDSSFCPRRS
jgi:hypothetical protein